VSLLLPFVPKEGEREVVEAFEQVMPIQRLAPTAREVADRRFFETVVRVHREGRSSRALRSVEMNERTAKDEIERLSKRGEEGK